MTVAAGSYPCTLDDVELDRILNEDVRHGDLTTAALDIGARPARVTLTARGAMVVCCIEEAARLFSRAGCHCTGLVEHGSRVDDGTMLLTVEGRADALHRVWKTAQTLIEYGAGIATSAAQIVTAVAGVGKTPAVVCTRKNFPGTRSVAALAVKAGGAQMHRLGLAESLLVFPEHRLFIPPTELTARLRQLKRNHPEKKLIAEAIDSDEAVALAHAGVEILQLEKFTPDQLAELLLRLQRLALPCLVAAAGGINAANAAAYARAGADILVTSAPYFAPPAEVQVRFSALV